MQDFPADTSRAAWRKSSYSGAQGDCLETSGDFAGVVPVRDGKSPDGPVLRFAAPGWASFVAVVRDGGFPADA
ncbi:DUF397 domain-containing protein [Streptomyces avicenniae]|uniref:DUF397 domain-containing protein n=1 Tax=Streptomyces avicenniae TaxID=500153 RepID=UPI0006996EB6|nr:DUF397 domain-containing protein [Streptomyces avicenniae]